MSGERPINVSQIGPVASMRVSTNSIRATVSTARDYGRRKCFQLTKAFPKSVGPPRLWACACWEDLGIAKQPSCLDDVGEGERYGLTAYTG